MKRKTIVLMIVISALFIAISCNVINNIIEKKKYENACNEAFVDLFVNERNQVITLYETFGNAIEELSDEKYTALFDMANTTETICTQVFGRNSDLVGTYGAGLVYYATFYRDIKSALMNKCAVDDLQDIYNLLGEIISLYDHNPNIANSSEQLKVISQFYYSLSLRNEDMMQLCKNY